MDIYLKGPTTGIELAKELKTILPFTPVVFLTAVNKAKPTTFKLTFSDFIFKQVLYPNHSSFRNWQYSIANFFAICRGHILKMPLHILLYHTAHKLYVQIFKSDNAADKVHAK